MIEIKASMKRPLVLAFNRSWVTFNSGNTIIQSVETRHPRLAISKTRKWIDEVAAPLVK